MDRTSLLALLYTLTSLFAIAVGVSVYFIYKDFDKKKRYQKIVTPKRVDSSVKINLKEKKIVITGWFQDENFSLKELKREFDLKEVDKYYKTNDSEAKDFLKALKTNKKADILKALKNLSGKTFRLYGNLRNNLSTISNVSIADYEKGNDIIFGTANETMYFGNIAEKINSDKLSSVKFENISPEIEKNIKTLKKKRFALTNMFVEPSTRSNAYNSVSLDLIMMLFSTYLNENGIKSFYAEDMSMYMLFEYKKKQNKKNRQRDISQELAKLFTNFANEIGISPDSNHFYASTFFFTEFNNETFKEAKTFLRYAQVETYVSEKKYIQYSDRRNEVKKIIDLVAKVEKELKSKKIEAITTERTSNNSKKYYEISLNLREEDYLSVVGYSDDAKLKLIELQLKQSIKLANAKKSKDFYTVFRISSAKAMLAYKNLKLPKNLNILFVVDEHSKDYILFDYVMDIYKISKNNWNYGLLFKKRSQIITQLLADIKPRLIMVERSFMTTTSNGSSTEFDYAQVIEFTKKTESVDLIELE